MSYILEALRKSERERTLGQVPSLDTVHHRARPPSALPWAVSVVALVLLLAVIGVWLLRDPRSTVQTADEPPAALPSMPVTETVRQSPPSSATAPVEPGKLVAAGALPPELRQQLPPLAVNVVSYSDNPGKRFIMINQRILREGERLDADISVREIMPDSARLEFRGHAFLVRP